MKLQMSMASIFAPACRTRAQNPEWVFRGIRMGYSGHGPSDFTMGWQWVCPSGAHVGFEWVNPNPCKSHWPTVTHAKPVWDYNRDGFAIWDS